MKKLKLAVIGGGSSYMPELIEGVILRHSTFPVSEVVLVDIEEGRHKLEIVAALAQRMIQKAGLPIELSATLDRQSALSHYDDGGIFAGEAALNEPAHLINLKRPLRDQDHIRPTRHPRVQGDPTRVTSHDLDDEHSVMAFGRRVKAIDRFGGDRHGGVESECVVGAPQVVVDRLGYPDDRKTDPAELRRYAERVLTTDDDKGVESQPLYRLKNTAFTVLGAVRIRTTGAEDGASTRKDASDIGHAQRCSVSIDRAAPTISETRKFVSVNLNAIAHNGPDDGVQSWAVPATSEHTDPHPSRV